MCWQRVSRSRFVGRTLFFSDLDLDFLEHYESDRPNGVPKTYPPTHFITPIQRFSSIPKPLHTIAILRFWTRFSRKWRIGSSKWGSQNLPPNSLYNPLPRFSSIPKPLDTIAILKFWTRFSPKWRIGSSQWGSQNLSPNSLYNPPPGFSFISKPLVAIKVFMFPLFLTIFFF